MSEILDPEDVERILSLRESYMEADMRLGEALHGMLKGSTGDGNEVSDFLREECLLAVLRQNKAYNHYVNMILACVGSPWCGQLFPIELKTSDRIEPEDSISGLG